MPCAKVRPLDPINPPTTRGSAVSMAEFCLRDEAHTRASRPDRFEFTLRLPELTWYHQQTRADSLPASLTDRPGRDHRCTIDPVTQW